MAITYDHAKRLVLLSAEIMEREPEKHGYKGGESVPFVEVLPGRRVCFCLMGGAIALLLAERGQSFVSGFGEVCIDDHGEAFADAHAELHEPLTLFMPDGRLMTSSLEWAHDTTKDASEMAANVRAIFAQHEGKEG